MVQYGAIDHVPSYNLSRGVVLFFPNCTTHVVPPLVRLDRSAKLLPKKRCPYLFIDVAATNHTVYTE